MAQPGASRLSRGRKRITGAQSHYGRCHYHSNLCPSAARLSPFSLASVDSGGCQGPPHAGPWQCVVAGLAPLSSAAETALPESGAEGRGARGLCRGSCVRCGGRGASRRVDRAPRHAPFPRALIPALRCGRRSPWGGWANGEDQLVTRQESRRRRVSPLPSPPLAGCAILQAGAVQGRDARLGTPPWATSLPVFSGLRKCPGHREPSLLPRAADAGNHGAATQKPERAPECVGPGRQDVCLLSH